MRNLAFSPAAGAIAVGGCTTREATSAARLPARLSAVSRPPALGAVVGAGIGGLAGAVGATSTHLRARTGNKGQLYRDRCRQG
jgi:hypothetical protein